MPSPYDRTAERYDRAIAPLEKHLLANLRVEALALIPSSTTILELGAGTGANFGLYPRCEQAVACELSFNMLEIAKGKTKSIWLVQADAQQLPFPANHFDAAFATLVFCTIPFPEKAFAEIVRTVKPGGKVILLEHVRPEGFLGYLFDVLNFFTVRLFDDHFNRRTAKEAELAGLKVIEVRRKALGIVNIIVCETDQYMSTN